MIKLQERLVNLKIEMGIKIIYSDATTLIDHIKEQKQKEANIT